MKSDDKYQAAKTDEDAADDNHAAVNTELSESDAKSDDDELNEEPFEHENQVGFTELVYSMLLLCALWTQHLIKTHYWFSLYLVGRRPHKDSQFYGEHAMSKVTQHFK